MSLEKIPRPIFHVCVIAAILALARENQKKSESTICQALASGDPIPHLPYFIEHNPQDSTTVTDSSPITGDILMIDVPSHTRSFFEKNNSPQQIISTCRDTDTSVTCESLQRSIKSTTTGILPEIDLSSCRD